MDPFHLSQETKLADNFMNHTDIELLVKEDITLQSVVETSSTNSKTQKENSIKYLNKIPGNYLHRLQNSKQNHTACKVKTVGDVRKEFETEQINKWSSILKSDESLIGKCNTSQFCLNRSKQELKTIITDQRPVTKYSWDNIHRLLDLREFTYLIADGKKVRLSGCTNGKCKEVKYSLFKTKLKTRKSTVVTKANKNEETTTVLDPRIIRKRGLLSTINIDFKPGPLSKKAKLNNTRYDSPEDLKLITIPPVGIEVYPRIGSKLDPAVCTRLNSVRSSDGFMDAKWAEFATSVLYDSNTSYTFTLPYENNQKRILFRLDPDFKRKELLNKKRRNNIPVDLSTLESPLNNLHGHVPCDNVQKVVVSMLDDMLKCVAISDLQDNIGIVDNDYVPVESNKLSSNSNSDGHKVSKKNRELSRLDVTVIDVSDDIREMRDCNKQYCKLGCVCSSLATSYMLNEHCGRIYCMLNECTCKFGKIQDQGDQHEIPKAVVANLQHHNNKYLSKEEQKFRRTVIKTKDNTIVIGASRRGQRLPKKYDDFIVADNGIENNENKRPVSIVNIHLNKLPSNLWIEPLCMVHGLYRCFCKGRMTRGTLLNNTNVTLRHDQTFVNDDNVAQRQTDSESSAILSTLLLNKNQTKRATNKRKSVESPSNTDVQKVSMKRMKAAMKEWKSRKTNKLNVEDKLSPYLYEPIRRNPIIPKLPNSMANMPSTSSSSNNICLIGNDAGTSDNNPKIDPSSNVTSKVKDISNKNDDCKEKSNKEIFPTTNVVIKSKTKQELVDEAIKLFSNPQRVVYFDVPEKCVFQRVILCKWSKLLEDFQSNEIYLWITENPPYSVFASKRGKLFTNKVFVPIVYGKPMKKNIVQGHGSLEHILCCNMTAYSFVAFVGRKFAWELLCTFHYKMDNEQSELTYPKITSVCGSYAEENVATSENVKSPNEELKTEDKELLGTQEPPNVETTEEINSSDTRKQQNSDRQKQNDINISPSGLITMEGKSKYRWLSLHLSGKFDTFEVLSKNFKISFQDVVEAMALAERSGKTVKYPTGPLLSKDNMPEFGVYAIPGNRLSQIFLGPYEFGEIANIKTSPQPVGESPIKGIWTKTMCDPRLVIWVDHRKKGQYSVLFIGKPFTTLRLSPSSQIFKQNIFNLLKLGPKTIDNASEISEASDILCNTLNDIAPQSTESTKSDDTDADDDVVYIPNECSVIELSDVEDES